MRQTLKEESYCYSILDECCREKLSRQEGQECQGICAVLKRLPGKDLARSEQRLEKGKGAQKKYFALALRQRCVWYIPRTLGGQGH